MNISTILRHWFTLAATALSGWLILPEAQQAELSKAMGDLVGPLAVVLTLLLAAVWRMAITWAGKIFDGGKKNHNPSGWGLLVMLGAMVALGTALPSCSPTQWAAARQVPVQGCVETDAGTVCYSSKSGLSYQVDTRSAK